MNGWVENITTAYLWLLLVKFTFHLSCFFIISLLVIYKLSTFHFIPHTSRVHSTVYIKLVQWTAVPLFVLKYYSKLTLKLKCTNWWVVQLIFQSNLLAPEEWSPSSTLLYLLSMDYIQSWDEWNTCYDRQRWVSVIPQQSGQCLHILTS